MSTRETPSFHPEEFRKATRSSENGNQCVAVARRAEAVEVRDTKTLFGTPADTRLRFTPAQFDHFLTH